MANGTIKQMLEEAIETATPSNTTLVRRGHCVYGEVLAWTPSQQRDRVIQVLRAFRPYLFLVFSEEFTQIEFLRLANQDQFINRIDATAYARIDAAAFAPMYSLESLLALFKFAPHDNYKALPRRIYTGGLRHDFTTISRLERITLRYTGIVKAWFLVGEEILDE